MYYVCPLLYLSTSSYGSPTVIVYIHKEVAPSHTQFVWQVGKVCDSLLDDHRENKFFFLGNKRFLKSMLQKPL